MQLSELLKVVKVKKVIGHLDTDIFGLAYDSRKVRPKGLFVAIKGTKYDGHNFIPQALKLGAKAVVVEKEQRLPSEATQIVVENTRLALGRLAACFYNYPSKKLNLVGITGTNGKTTVSHLLAAIFKESGSKVGIIGTIGYLINGKKYQAEQTTPQSLDLQQMLQEMVNQQVGYATLEVSSHALELHRPAGCFFKAAVFTNVSHDHLDFHKTMESYFAAKSQLFKKDEYSSQYQVINVDDSYGQRLISLLDNKAVTYGLKAGDYTVDKIERVDAKGLKLVVKGPGKDKVKVESNLIGYFNIYNLLTAVATAKTLGFTNKQIAAGIKELEFVPGRFAPVNCGQNFHVIVDYAHTPDGLKKVIESSRHLGVKRVITVFGCGGDRDKTKRPLMGEIAARLSDFVIVTSDNPRSEKPEEIIADIVKGIPQSWQKATAYQTIIDREKAIEAAIKMAKPNDLVLLAGKGHEDYQIIGDKIIPFDDCQVAKSILERMLALNGAANHR